MIRPLAALALAALAFPAHAQDAAAGQRVYARQCASCHGDGGEGGIGPALGGVAGRAAGADPGYGYSAAMRQSGIIWTADELARFLVDPQARVKGTRMAFPGLPAKDAADVAAHLATLKP